MENYRKLVRVKLEEGFGGQRFEESVDGLEWFVWRMRQELEGRNKKIFLGVNKGLSDVDSSRIWQVCSSLVVFGNK